MMINSINNQNQHISFGQLSSKYKKVDKYLLRGPHPRIRDLFELKKEGVNQIYDFRHDSPYGFKFIERLVCKLLNIKYKRFAHSYTRNQYTTLNQFESISQDVFTNGQNGGKTLFHCNTGRHRTAQMSAFYQITQGKTLQESKEQLKGNFFAHTKEAIQSQMPDNEYFSRTTNHYSGKNPIKRFLAKWNNKIKQGTEIAFYKFNRMIYE